MGRFNRFDQMLRKLLLVLGLHMWLVDVFLFGNASAIAAGGARSAFAIGRAALLLDDRFGHASALLAIQSLSRLASQVTFMSPLASTRFSIESLTFRARLATFRFALAGVVVEPFVG
jgi:hypothetical protein